MNAAKIDPHLKFGMASSPSEPRRFFVQVAPGISEHEANKVRDLGVRNVSRSGGTFSATASRAEVEALSDLDCVTFLQGSYRLTTSVRPA